jgi:hypothetical protein
LILGLIAFLLGPPPTHSPSRPVCRDARDCNVAGTRALASGEMEKAEACFEQEVRFGSNQHRLARC